MEKMISLKIMRCLWLWLPFQVMGQVNPLPLDSLIQHQVDSIHQEGLKASQETNGWMLAMKYHADAYNLSTKYHYSFGQANALRQLAILEAKAANRKEKAFQYFLDELKIREKIGNLLEVANTYELMGDFFRYEWIDTPNAIGYYKQALLLRKQSNADNSILIKTLFMIGNSYQNIDQIPQAIHFFEEIATLYSQSGQYEDGSKLYLELAQIQSKLKNYQKAIENVRKAQKIYQASQPSDNFNTKFEQSIQTLQKLEQDQQAVQRKWTILFYLSIMIGCMLLTSAGIWYFKKHPIKSKLS